MKSRKITFLSLLMLGSVSLSACYVDLGFIHFGTPDEEQGEVNEVDGKLIYDAEAQNSHIQEYYATINSSQSGDTLLSSLRNLNLAKRKKVVEYANMGTNPAGKYKFTDYDTRTVKFNNDGIPYGTKILSFYSGKSTSSFDREHVWPASRLPGGRDGNIVDSDILMPRPTDSVENQSRGNSVYVTDANSSTNGWDPVAAFSTTLGNYEGIRGECARIIFYCLTVDDRCVIDDDISYTSGCTHMGKISDLIEWTCDNPVNMREKRRQVGAEYLQGNRNAFVDHPEYACKIWGGTNARTKAACQRAGYAIN